MDSNDIIKNLTELNPEQEQNKEMIEHLDDLSSEFPRVEKIDNKSSKIESTTNYEIKSLNKNIKNKKLPYPDGDEIPEIKIRDHNSLVSGGKIEKINFYQYYNDDKFNKCNECKNVDAKRYYCEACRKNLCKNCSGDCKERNHKLIDLHEELKELDKFILDINNIKSKYLIKPEEKPVNPNEKFSYDYSFDLNDKDESLKSFSYPNDIELIDLILEKKYINYFHFQNIKECYNYLKKIYIDINNEDDCIRIEYKFKDIKEKRFKIFGHTFVENNKDNIKLIINNENSDLVETVVAEKIVNNYLEVILIQKSVNDKKKYINNLSCMFCDCKSDEIIISKINEKNLLDLSNVINISNMFKNCSNLQKIDLTFLQKIYNIKRMDYLFCGCKSLENIDNIKLLNTKFVTNMNNMFNGCEDLKNVDDIKEFITDNVEYLKGMFKHCRSLEELPNLSGWNLENVKSMKGMFKDCTNLEELSGISGWNVKNVKSLKGMLKGCKNLKELPDISGWNVENVISMEELFSGCEELESLPNLKNWKLKSIENIDKIFFGCKKIKQNNIKDILNIPNFEIISCDNVF